MIIEGAYRCGWLEAAESLAEPYPKDLFTEISDEELARVRAALDEHCDVRFPMERMHASWARHWSQVLRRQIEEAEL